MEEDGRRGRGVNGGGRRRGRFSQHPGLCFSALIAALITLISCLPAIQQPETGRLRSQKVLGDEFPRQPRGRGGSADGGVLGGLGQREQVEAGGEGWDQGVQKANLQLFEQARPAPTEALESAPWATLP